MRLPSGDQAKLVTALRPSVSGVASPPSRRRSQICVRGSSPAGLPGVGRAARKASVRPSGDQAGDDSPRSPRSEEHTSELQSLAYLVCRLLLEKKKKKKKKE